MLNMTISRSPIVLLLVFAWPFSLVAQCDLSKCPCLKRGFRSGSIYLAWSSRVDLTPSCGSVEGGTVVQATLSLVPEVTGKMPFYPGPDPRILQAEIHAIDEIFVDDIRISEFVVTSELPSSSASTTFTMPPSDAPGEANVVIFYDGGYTCLTWLGREKDFILPNAAAGVFEYIEVSYPVVTDACPGYLDPTGRCNCLPYSSTPADRNVDPPCCSDGMNTLTIIGSGFHRDSNGDIPMVWIDGIERSSPNVVWVSESELRVVLPEKTFTDAGYVEVMVRNPPFTCGNIDCATDECGVFYIPQGGCTTGPSDGPEYQTGFVGRGPHYVDTGNVIDDPSGHKDVVVASVTDDGGMLTILEGNGDGSVTSAYGMDAEKASERQWKLYGVPTAIDVGDLNGDGSGDVAVTTLDSDGWEVWQSLGPKWTSGDFLNYTSGGPMDGSDPTDIKVADVYGEDGVPDLLIASSWDAVTLVCGHVTTGEWGTELMIPIRVEDEAGSPCSPLRLVTGDVDGDGITDFAAITERNSVVLFRGTNVELKVPTRIDGMNLGSTPVDVKMIPLMEDGRLGLAVLRQDRSIDLIGYDPATGLLQEPPVNIALSERTGSPTVMAKGDFNDGAEGDLVVAYDDGSVEVVFLDLTAGPRLLGTQVLELPDQAPISDLAADKLNADPTTREDLVIAPGNGISQVVIAVNKGSGFE